MDGMLDNLVFGVKVHVMEHEASGIGMGDANATALVKDVLAGNKPSSKFDRWSKDFTARLDEFQSNINRGIARLTPDAEQDSR